MPDSESRGSGATIVEADMRDRDTLWRRCVGPMVVVLLAVVPLLATGCASAHSHAVVRGTPRTETLDHGIVIRHWPEAPGHLVALVELPPVPAAEASHEWTIPHIAGAGPIRVWVRPINASVPILPPRSIADQRASPMSTVMVRGVMTDVATGETLADTRYFEWVELSWHAANVGGFRYEPAEFWESGCLPHIARPNGSTVCSLRIAFRDLAAARAYCDQLQFFVAAFEPAKYDPDVLY